MKFCSQSPRQTRARRLAVVGNRSPLPALLALLLLTLWPGEHARADTAILIGVDRVPALGKAADLPAATGDVVEVRTLLGEAGFRPVVLTGDAATSARLRTELAKVAPSERLALYISARGTTLADGQSALLMADSRPGDRSSLLTLPALGAMVRGARARQKAVFLDASFVSGTGGSKAAVTPADEEAKYFAFADDAPHAKSVRGVNDTRQLNLPGDVLVLTASRAGQPAFASKGENPLSRFGRWLRRNGETVLRVAGSATGLTPIVEAAVSIFGGGRTTGTPPPAAVVEVPANIQDAIRFAELLLNRRIDIPGVAPIPDVATLLSLDSIDNSLLSLALETPRLPLHAGDPLRLKVTTGKPGWLFVVDVDDANNVVLLRHWGLAPVGLRTEDFLKQSQISGAQSFYVGRDDNVVSVNARADGAAASDRVKAIFFTEKKDAEQFAALWLRANPTRWSDLLAAKLPEGTLSKAPTQGARSTARFKNFVTADLTYTVIAPPVAATP